ncbi:hypothetical protein WJX74_004526 [Apatococcus lobatus]|uniref:Protein kinase domain-containing protein n=1 Tax=Apatococcus lobatus TaxID=904363 RepID=A0AAW1SAI0_9CHLO
MLREVGLVFKLLRFQSVLLVLALVFPGTSARVKQASHETAECTKLDMSLRELLCARGDSAIMCQWLDDDAAENGTAEAPTSSFWSLAAGLTFFLVADAALLSTHGLPSGVSKRVMHALAGHRPLLSSLSGHPLLWRIASPLPISRLLAISMLPAQLVDSFGHTREHPLRFVGSAAGLGANVSVGASAPSFGIVHSIQACDSWIHFTDGLLLPSASRASGSWAGLWSTLLPWMSTGPSLQLKCLTVAMGAVGLLLSTARARGWLQCCLSYLWHRAIPSQASMSVNEGASRSSFAPEAGGSLPGTPMSPANPGSGSPGLEDLGPLISQRSIEQQQVGIALERLLEALPEGGQAIRIQRDRQKGLMLVTEPSLPLDHVESRAGVGVVCVPSVSTPNLLQLLTAQGEKSEAASPLSPTSSRQFLRRSAEAASRSSSFQRGRVSKESDQYGSSLGGLPDMEDAVPGRRSLSTRPVGLRPSICGPRSAFFLPGGPSAADDRSAASAHSFCTPIMQEEQAETMLADAEAAPGGAGSAAMELVSDQLQQADSRFWELEENDLSVCLRPDGSDWQLGSGFFGTVYRGLLQGSTPVAIKFISNQTLKEKLRFIQEIALLRNLRHTNIVQFIGAHIDVEQIVLVTEFMPRGDLWHALSSDIDRSFCWAKRGRQVALDVVRGLMYFHSKQCVHLDLKSANVMLSRDGVAKIGDVGLAKVLTREGARVSQEGTFEWAAPEVLMGNPCTEKADIYSLGVLMWELITGEQPRLRSLREFEPDEAPAPVCDIAMRCRHNDPAERPTAADVFKVLSVDRPRPASRALSASSRHSGSGGSAVSLQSEGGEPLLLFRGGKAHSWDATASHASGRRPSATRSVDIRASIEPQVEDSFKRVSSPVKSTVHHKDKSPSRHPDGGSGSSATGRSLLGRRPAGELVVAFVLTLMALDWRRLCVPPQQTGR